MLWQFLSISLLFLISALTFSSICSHDSSLDLRAYGQCESTISRWTTYQLIGNQLVSKQSWQNKSQTFSNTQVVNQNFCDQNPPKMALYHFRANRNYHETKIDLAFLLIFFPVDRSESSKYAFAKKKTVIDCFWINRRKTMAKWMCLAENARAYVG